MAESSSVRLLQQHLRQAGTLLAARQFDAALKHIDAALAIDPASLAALTLRDRLMSVRTRVRPTPSPSTDPDRSDTHVAQRFVPTGVNAASWLDFEQRIQERRFRALIEAADRAVAAGDGVAARAAIEEARELQPDSGDVARLSARVALLRLPAVRPQEGFFRSRTFRAASLLLLGVMSLMGLDWVRSETPRKTDAKQGASETTADSGATVSAPSSSEGVQTLGPVAEVRGTSGVSPERLPLTYKSVASPTAGTTPVPPAPVPVVTPAPPAPERSLVPGETADDYVIPSSAGQLRAAASTPPIVRGEVSDDYVAPRRDAGRDAAVAPGRAGSSVPLGNIVRQPVTLESIGNATPGVPPSAVLPSAVSAPPAAAPVIAPTAGVNEGARINSVLNQYASAYGQLNAAAVRSIWPTVDERALAKAFANLSSQTMSFDSCEIDVNGATARASCRGRASYVVKVGSQERRNEPRTVRFDLRRDGESWKIMKAETWSR
jgi:hypothetical protein